MLATMPRKPRKDSPRKVDYVDVFSRMDADTVAKLDELADDQHRSRSGMVAWLVEQYIATEYPKLLAKRGG
jgi:hypothetical protein